MAIEFKDGKYVDANGHVTLDPTIYKDWQIAEEAEKALPPVDYFREKLGLSPPPPLARVSPPCLWA